MTRNWVYSKSFVKLSQQNVDGTTSQDVLTFDVWNDDEGDGPTPYAFQDFQFVPGGVASSTVPGNVNDYVGTSFYLQEDSETYTVVAGCPAAVDDSTDEDDYGSAVSHTAGTQTCTDTPLSAGYYEPDGDEAYYNDDSDSYQQENGPVWTAFTIPVAPTRSIPSRRAPSGVTSRIG